MPALEQWVVDLVKRDEDSWRSSDQARSIKWGIFFGILTFFLVLMTAMYCHADSRMRSGKAPFLYHRWLVPRTRRAQFEPHLAQPEESFSFYHQNQQQENGVYGMHTVPPPAYNPSYPEPPIYSGGPPIGVAKVDPSQHPAYQLGEGSGGGPVSPPPAAVPAYTPREQLR